jgi:hypothetical protein
MTTVPPSSAVAEVWERVKAWPASDKISFSSEIVQSLEQGQNEPPLGRQVPLKPKGSVADIIGLWADVHPKPTDEELEQLLIDSILEKHG